METVIDKLICDQIIGVAFIALAAVIVELRK